MSALRFLLTLIGCLIYSGALLAQGGANPLTVTINTVDAERFAKLFDETGGLPSAAQLQTSYLDGAAPGVAIFTPNRIENAENLAAAVAKDTPRYAYAIKNCLPLVGELTGQLRATYLAYRGLTPARPLPEFYLIFGAGNSGGFATPEAQVIALEVMCGPGTQPDQFRASMRGLFAHETVHSWQTPPKLPASKDLLLLMAFFEGVPDFLATTVTGTYPNADRAAWGAAREAEIWADFQRDRAIIRKGTRADDSLTPDAEKAMKRWFYNYGSAPEGWPFEAGYWVGSRIAAAYFEKATDKQQGIADLIAAKDPEAMLAASGYGSKRAEPKF